MSEESHSRYLQYLPGIYAEDPFLDQFLLPFEEVLRGFEELLSDIDRTFAPALTDSEFLPWLAGWVALVLDEDWDEAKRRRLICEAVQLYRWRGTVKGLQDYLEIYTERVPQIRECRWPGGMQIGVASRIGGPPAARADDDTPLIPPDGYPARIQHMSRAEPLAYYDYYEVYLLAAEGQAPGRVYHRTDQVVQVEVDDTTVVIVRTSSEEPITYEPATITRRDGLIDDLYTLSAEVKAEEGTELIECEYGGDGLLIDEVERPYRFVVDVRAPREDVEQGTVKLDKVRDIVDLEKPAHTMYYLKLTPVVSEVVLQSMQVGIRSRSTIGVSTTIG